MPSKRRRRDSSDRLGYASRADARRRRHGGVGRASAPSSRGAAGASDGWHCVLVAARGAAARAGRGDRRTRRGLRRRRPRGGRRGRRARARAAPRIELLVNNAGIPGRGEFLDGDPERIESVMRINYLGGVWCLRAFLPGARGGRAVATSSTSSRSPATRCRRRPVLGVEARAARVLARDRRPAARTRRSACTPYARLRRDGGLPAASVHPEAARVDGDRAGADRPLDPPAVARDRRESSCRWFRSPARLAAVARTWCRSRARARQVRRPRRAPRSARSRPARTGTRSPSF